MGEDDFYGAISTFGGAYAPVNYATCQGQLFAIEQYAALYALIGTYYQGAGNGATTFNLPNLSGGTTVGIGQQPTTGAFTELGETGQAAQVILSNGPAAAFAVGDTPTMQTVTSVPTLGVSYVMCVYGAWPVHP
ncbi:MAG: phage tail protein [Actinobacteria bacterium]|nr:phage tail protein [Actinomycetota bacterium]